LSGLLYSTVERFAFKMAIRVGDENLASERREPRAWAGDPAAFDGLYREMAPRVRAFLRQFVVSSQAAEDLTQEIFAQLWSHPEGFDSARGSLQAYLFGAARHCAARSWRRNKPETVLTADRPDVSDLERDSVIGDALRRLPEEQRSLLWLREVEGQSYEELAVILEIPIGTVRSRLSAARKAMREIWLRQSKKGVFHDVR
jgi:RNA polymerase sigma-70 factor (ECF subfamily)